MLTCDKVLMPSIIFAESTERDKYVIVYVGGVV